MAQRRMFSLKIVDTDAFLDMPLSTQALYFHLSMRADDDGFVSNPRRIIKTIGCNPDDMNVLLGKKFVIRFESGICVIKHWKMHNYIQKDRYSETTYLEEKKQLITKDNGSYSTNNKECIQNVSKVDTQVRLGKVSIGKETYSPDLIKNYPFVTDSLFKKTFDSYINYRKKIKKPTTEHAIELLLKKLKQYDIETSIKMIENSIENGWIGIFPLKEGDKKSNGQYRKLA